MVKPPVRENVVENELIARVKRAGGIAEKATTLGWRGFFDRIVILPGGRVIWVEVKKPVGGRVSPHQRLRHARYRALGMDVRLIRDFADIDRLMTEG